MAGQTSLRGISNRAAKDKAHRFGNLCGLLDENFLKWCFWQLKRDAAPGVDRVGFYEYQENLDENIANLVNRLKQKKYRAKLVRRQYIPKINGKLRPLGIPATDDKVLQYAVNRPIRPTVPPGRRGSRRRVKSNFAYLLLCKKNPENS